MIPHVVFLNRRYCPGEAWTNRVLAYAKGFAEAGVKVTLCFLITDSQRSRPDITIDGVNVVNLWEKDGFIARRFKMISFIKNLFCFHRLVNNGDRLFVYGSYWYLIGAALMVKPKARVFCEITEHPLVFNASKASQRRNANNIKLLNKTDGIFVISNTLKKYYVESGVSEDKIHVINMFVDTNRFKDLKKTTKEKYIGYCGAVSYDKDGVDTLIKAFSIFHNIHKDYVLKIIGKGVSSNVVPDLKRLAVEYGVGDSTIFTGQVSPEKMPQLLYDSSILALARPDSLQAQNGFPTKLGEYLATGNPVVVTKVGEIPDFLTDGGNAFLASPGNPEEFAKQLCNVADNYEKAKEIGLRGRLLSFTEFGYGPQSKKALQFLNE